MDKFLKKKNFSKVPELLLHNQYVLYFIFVLAVGNLFHYSFSYDLTSVAVFIVTGLLTSFFSKNMIVILVIAMVVSNIFRYGNKGTEGFQKRGNELDDSIDEAFQDVIDSLEEDEDDEDDDEDMEDDDEDMEDDEEEDDMADIDE